MAFLPKVLNGKIIGEIISYKHICHNEIAHNVDVRDVRSSETSLEKYWL